MGDAGAFAELEGDSEVVKYTGYPTANPAQAKQDLEFCIANYEMKNPEKLIYAVCKRDTHEFIGTFALLPMEHQTIEIGYRFIRRFWGNGFASEMLSPFMQWALNQEGVKTLYAEADVRNKASIAMLERTMMFQQEVFNEKLNCTDRQYVFPASQNP